MAVSKNIEIVNNGFCALVNRAEVLPQDLHRSNNRYTYRHGNQKRFKIVGRYNEKHIYNKLYYYSSSISSFLFKLPEAHEKTSAYGTVVACTYTSGRLTS